MVRDMKLAPLCPFPRWPAPLTVCVLMLSACGENRGESTPDAAQGSNEAGMTARDGGPNVALDAGSSDAAMDAGSDAAMDAADVSETSAPEAADTSVPPILPEVDAEVLPDGGKACYTPPWGMIELSESSVRALEGCTVLRGDLRMGDQLTVKEAIFPQSLREVEGTLNFFRNQTLKDIRALRNLSVVGRLLIHHNYELETLTGLESLRTVRGQLLISSNTRLRSLSGLSGLKTVGELNVGGNEALPLSELEQLQKAIQIVPLDAGS
jgi:hypothetical protein